MEQIQATYGAFAAILEDGSVITWGRPGVGGDSSAVRDQLMGVQQIQATDAAFAAILEDGSVVSWGHADFGGDSSAVRNQLKGVCVKNAMGSASRREQMQVLLLLNTSSLRRFAVVLFSMNMSEPRLKFVMFTRYRKNVSCIQDLLPVLSNGYS